MLHLQLPGNFRSASPFFIGDPRSVVGIVVTGLASSPAGAEVRVVNKMNLLLDYLIRWDYIHTCGYRIRFEVLQTATGNRGNGVGLTSQLPLH